MSDSPEITVTRDALKKALLQLKKVAKPRPKDEATVWSDGGKLRILIRQLDIGIDAEGELGARVRVNADMLVRMHMTLPKVASLRLKVEGSTFCIESFMVSCMRLPDSK